MENEYKIELSRPIRVKDLKKRVTHLAVSARPEELAALAERFGLPRISKLEAAITIERLARDQAIRIEGDLDVSLTYVSVVSLEPFETLIAEHFSEVLGAESDTDGRIEIDLPPDEENMGSIIDGGFDLGEVISQNLSLLLDEHPRKPGENDAPDGVVWADDDAEDKKENPFSVLADMRDRMRKGD